MTVKGDPGIVRDLKRRLRRDREAGVSTAREILDSCAEHGVDPEKEAEPKPQPKKKASAKKK